MRVATVYEKGEFEPVPQGHGLIDRQAEALADIKRMHDELISNRSTIGQLKADLNRERDRVEMLGEDRDRYRAEAMLFRNLLIELSTQMANIGLLTAKAQEIVRTVNDLDKSNTTVVKAMATVSEAPQGEGQNADAA